MSYRQIEARKEGIRLWIGILVSSLILVESPSKNNAPERVTDASAAYPDESVGKAPSESSQP